MQDVGTQKSAPSNKSKKKKNFELEERWSKVVTDQGFSAIPSVLLKSQRRLGLSNNHVVILMHLIDHWFGKDQTIHPSMQLIAERMGLSKSYVRSLMAQLENLGFLIRKKRYEKRSQTSNSYYLDGLVEKLIPLAEEHKEIDEAKKLLEKRQQPKLKNKKDDEE